MPDQTTQRNDPAEPSSDLLTIAEAAELLRAPVATLRYWRHLGNGPCSFRLGRRVVYRRDDLLAWIDAQRDQGGVVVGAGRSVKVEPTALPPRARPREAERGPGRVGATTRPAARRKE